MTRTLAVLRHAKSDWPVGVPDQDRPLARRGTRDAAAVGRWLAADLGTPDVVWCSPARRTRETWSELSAQLDAVPEVRIDERVYQADVSALLSVLADSPRDSGLVLLIGHNPGVQHLVLSLTDRSAARALAETKFPTCGLAVLQVSQDWAELGDGHAELTEFVVPRG